MRLKRVAGMLLASMVLAACGSTPPPPTTPVASNAESAAPDGSPSGMRSAPPSADPSAATQDPIDVQAMIGADEALAVPEDPEAAAAYLAGAVREPRIARAAVREILARSGIGIFSADTGALAVQPSDPALVDAYLYEFEIPILANAVAGGTRTTLAPALGILAALGIVPGDTDLGALEEALALWADGEPGDPRGPLAFGRLAVRELVRADAAAWSEAGDVSSSDGSGASPVLVDPLVLQLFIASLVATPGHFEVLVSRAPPAPSAVLASTRHTGSDVVPAAPDGTVCNEPASEYGSGFLEEGAKELAKWIGKKKFGEKWTDRADMISEVGGMVTTAMARAALLNGLTLTVTSNAKGTPHYRHSTGHGAGSSVWTFTAKAMFKTGLGSKIVKCGALAGMRIPADGGVEGMRLQWAISDHIQCTELSRNCDKLGRITSGGGGVSTDASGESRLQVETIIEKGCPASGGASGTSSCAKGPVVKANAWSRVTPDLTREPPIKIAELLLEPMASSGAVRETVAKALAKVLLDLATDIVSNTQAAKGYQAVEFHDAADYRVDGRVGGMTFKGTKCGGPVGDWKLEVGGSPASGVSTTGSITFTLDETAHGSAKIAYDVVFQKYGQTSTTRIRAEGDVALLSATGDARLRFTNLRGVGTVNSGSVQFRSGIGGANGFPVQRGTFCSAP